MRPTAGIFALASALAIAALAGALTVAAPAFAYPVLDQAHAFRGRITYTVRPADGTSAPGISGQLVVDRSGWTLEEHAPLEVARAGTRGATVDSTGVHVGVDDPLAAGSIANAWAIAVGTLATQPVSSIDGDGVWQTARLRLYLNDARDSVVGMADTAGIGDVSFSFDDWVDVSGMLLPKQVMRLRGGVSEAAFAISDYSVLRAIEAEPTPAPAHRHIVAGSVEWTAAQPPIRLATIEFPWRLFLTAFGSLLLALIAVAWTRRDALLQRLCRWVEDDPRGWEMRGVSVFVSPEGRLWFDGSEYRVGAQFYNRTAVVQASPLFLRIGSREVPRAVIVARKFRPLAAAVKPHGVSAPSSRTRSAHGFSLIETLVAVAVFATVVVGAVFPTLVVMARGDAIAATQEDAVRIAANALSDQEAACAYGVVPDGTVTSQIGELTLTVTVGPSASGAAGASDIIVSVNDQSGRTLARAISTVGPAVPIPPPPNSTPNPMPSGATPPPTPPPTPSPSPSSWPSG
jgi:prepilin-type N-terminal cleavage/methylation domain-containing protein